MSGMEFIQFVGGKTEIVEACADAMGKDSQNVTAQDVLEFVKYFVKSSSVKEVSINNFN